MLAKYQEKADANQAKADANLKEVMARMNANQATADAYLKQMTASLREEIKSGQAEMRSTVSALVGNMDAWIWSILT
jgi:hypothetical protein